MTVNHLGSLLKNTFDDKHSDKTVIPLRKFHQRCIRYDIDNIDRRKNTENELFMFEIFHGVDFHQIPLLSVHSQLAQSRLFIRRVYTYTFAFSRA